MSVNQFIGVKNAITVTSPVLKVTNCRRVEKRQTKMKFEEVFFFFHVFKVYNANDGKLCICLLYVCK